MYKTSREVPKVPFLILVTPNTPSGHVTESVAKYLRHSVPVTWTGSSPCYFLGIQQDDEFISNRVFSAA